MSSPKEMSVNLLDLFQTTSDLTFCTYKELGLLCFDGYRLVLVSVLPPQSNQPTPVFVRKSTISFAQAPPGTSEIIELSVSPNGRFVALVGERCVYIVELDEAFWSNQSLFTSVTLTNLRQNYTVSCEILNVNLVLSKRSGSIRKIAWLNNPNEMNSTSILGVLYSTSVVRIYNVTASKSAPIALADFQRILTGYEPDESYKSVDGTHLGLISEIVTFDFGPILTHKNHVYYTVFAIDSDGEIYYNACSTRAESRIDPIGPLALDGMDTNQKSFFFNSTEMHFINHSKVYDLPVFAFCSEQGELFHVLLHQQEKSLEKLLDCGKNIYRLTIIDSMQIEDWPLNNANVALRGIVYVLFNITFSDPDVPGEYFVVTSTEVYLINPLPWIKKLDLLMDNPNASSTPLPASDVRHFFKIMGAGSEATTVISAISSLRIEDNTENGSLNLSLFVVLDTSPRVNANFVQRRLNVLEGSSGAGKSSSQQVTAQFTAQARLNLKAPTFTLLPKLSTADLEHAQRQKAMIQALQATGEQTKQLNAAVSDARHKTQQMAQRYTTMDQSYEQYCERLVKIFESLHQHKRILSKVTETLPRDEDRLNLVVSLVQNRVYAPTQKEDDAAKKLRETLDRADQLYERIRKCNSKLDSTAGQKRLKPFQASSSAQRFMLTKNAVEINQLTDYINQLKKDFEKLMA